MTIRQIHFVPPVSYLIAEEYGLFAAAGVEVEARRTRSSSQQLDALRAGEVDVAVTAMDNVFIWNALGADTRVVAQLEQTTLLSVYATPGHQTLQDLDGGRFAVDAVANGFAIVARRILEDAGVSVSFMEVGGVKERLDALVAGSSEATLLGPPLDELAERAGMVFMASANDALPALPGQGAVVRAVRTEREDAELRAYLGALDAAVARSETIPHVEGMALLERQGFVGLSAAEIWRTRPRSLGVDPEGLALLEAMRADFELLPEGYSGLSTIAEALRLDRVE
ncbi:ABC transporter substrate-binding protein [Microbacterium sp.]|uniref:ABC transporter substrate-binding protein n=1 Tax=Microbacterium sp. TaxID=51671 RepID=UPI003A945441